MLQQYLSTIKNANTRRAYANDLGEFETWASVQGVELAQLGVRHLMSYREYLAEHRQPATVNRALASLRAYARWAAQHELVPAAVVAAAQAVDGLKLERKLPRLLTDAEFEALTCLPEAGTVLGARDLAFIRLLRFSGVRVSEAVGLSVEDVQFDAEGGQAMVFGKGAKHRVVVFDADTAAALRHYLRLRGSPARGPLFTNHAGQRVTDRWMREQLADYGERIGRPDLHPHLLRHAFATWLLDETGDEDTVRGLLGHEDTKTLRVYTRLATKRYRAVYNRAVKANEGPAVLEASHKEVLAN